jgi:MFS family permease
VPANTAYVSRLLPLLVLFGLGGGLTLPAVTSLGMSGATDADSGVLSGVFNTAQQVGGALGLTVLTTLAASRTGTAQTPQALTSGYHLAWTIGAILAGASVAVAAIALRQPSGPDRQRQSGNRSAARSRDPLLGLYGPAGQRPAGDAPRSSGTRGIPDSVESEG